jgi:pyridoxine 5-phosphate synthase
MTLLSVNVNKIATLRNSRGQNFPNVLKVAEDLIACGAHGITVHPRPDERHIKRQDTYDLSAMIMTLKARLPHLEFNIEGYPSDEFMHLIDDLRPDQCTLVPDPPHVLTSNAGWDLTQTKLQLREALTTLKNWGVRSSVFLDPCDNSRGQFAALAELGPDRIELYTERFAKDDAQGLGPAALKGYKELAAAAVEAQVGVNAGHDLNLQNLKNLVVGIPEILEVSIGHALICEALYLGFEKTLDQYLIILGHRSK